MDFIDRLQEVASKIDVPVIIQAIDQEESIRLAPLPGGRTVKSYMNGDKVKELPFEFRYKTQNFSGDRVIYQLSEILENVKPISSKNGTYQFMALTISNEPFLLGQDDKKFFYYRLVVQAKLYFKNKSQESED
ncbi:phage tail terminator protein [Enterococcus mundtii]|uniref:Minor capsid protein n=1 Tax=Enterococcus mundtii TaxID=53346 RepID=A0A1V2UDS4_ENTMU|nr:minor capsid protein [Enterococcus mundtii]ONN41096.1 minor capsid protein [Enterococcus mundtii]